MILLLKTKTKNKKCAAPRYPKNQTAAYKILISHNDDFYVALYINLKKMFCEISQKTASKKQIVDNSRKKRQVFSQTMSTCWILFAIRIRHFKQKQ